MFPVSWNPVGIAVSQVVKESMDDAVARWITSLAIHLTFT